MADFWSILQRHLGTRTGLTLQPVSTDGHGGPPVVVRADQRTDRTWLLLHAEGRPSPAASCLLRLSSVTGETAAKVRQETRDLSSEALPTEGTTRPAIDFTTRGPERVVLPPLYFCRQKGKWIGVVCPGCSGIPSDLDGKDEERCELCGAARSAGEAPTPEMSSPLEVLWTTVQQGPAPRSPSDGEAAQHGRMPDPYCLECERKLTCFSPSGSRVEPRGALEALIPVMATPWSGSLVAGFDLPLAAWLKLVKDPDIDLASITPGLPRTVLDPIAAAAKDRQGRLVPAEFKQRALGESLLLRLEVLRQLLAGIRGVHSGLQHPHLDVRPESIWVGQGRRSSLAPSLWSPDVQLIDLAPCHTGADQYVHAPDLPAELTPPKSKSGSEGISGILVPRGETVEEEGRTGVKFLFLPQGECEDPPGENEPVTLAMVQDDTESRAFDARVEVNLKDVYRLVIFIGDIPKDKIDEELKGLGSQAVLRKAATDAEHAVDPDLYAAGTIWMALLRWNTEDLAGCAALRETLLQTLETEDALRGDHAVAERICLTTANEHDDLFRIQFEASGAEGSASMAGRLLGKCLWLGLRMCGALPEIFNNEPAEADGSIRSTVVLDHVLREIVMLQGEARYLMLGRSSAREEILSVIRSCQADLLEA